MRKCPLILALAVWWVLNAAHGRAEEVLEIALVPISSNARLVPGAFGSLWRTSFLSTNLGTEQNIMLQYPWFDSLMNVPTIQPLFPLPRRTDDMGWNGTAGMPFLEWEGYQGILVRFPRSKRELLRLSLRIQDVSRQAETWGTEVPVVREDDFKTDTIHLIGIPVDSRFRTMLRLYDVDRRGGTVRLRAYAFDTEIPSEGEDEFLGEITVDLDVPVSDRTYIDPFRPGYAQLAQVPARFSSGGPYRRMIRLEVDGPPGTRYWAFVSVTNDETQHVTLVTPASP